MTIEFVMKAIGIELIVLFFWCFLPQQAQNATILKDIARPACVFEGVYEMLQ